MPLDWAASWLAATNSSQRRFWFGLLGLLPVPPLAIALVAAVRHAALHCGQPWRSTSPTRTSGKQVVERPPRIFPVVCRPPRDSALGIEPGSFSSIASTCTFGLKLATAL
jgi:hypothetical protein